MWKRYKFGIKIKITTAFSLVFICLSLFFNMYCYHKIRSLLINDNNKYLLNRADRFLSKIDVSPVIIPLPGNNTMIRVLYHSGSERHTVFESPGIINKIPTPKSSGVTDTLNMRVTYVTNSSEDNPAELVLVTDGSELNESLDYLLILLVACSLVSVLIAGLVSYILAFYLLRPVQKIINSANVINTNELNDLIPVSDTHDELQELTETINRMLTRIEKSVQQQQSFFASASHELKTPLAIMKAELELGLKKPNIDADMSGLLSSQLQEINRLQLVVQEFLMVSQLKNGSITAHKEPVDVAALIIKAFSQLNALFAAKNLKPAIEFDKNTDSFIIPADKEKLWIVLLNIIENAVKYSPIDTVINCVVKSSAGNDHLSVVVENSITGVSVDTAYLQDAFYRASPLQPGSGIGLWLCSQLIKSQAGTLALSSNHGMFKAELQLAVTS